MVSTPIMDVSYYLPMCGDAGKGGGIGAGSCRGQDDGAWISHMQKEGKNQWGFDVRIVDARGAGQGGCWDRRTWEMRVVEDSPGLRYL